MKPKPAPGGHDDSTTLGDLLYPDRSEASIPEDDWVRLVESIAAGDQQALRALYERTHRLVFTLAMRICGIREMAEEVTLDVFHDVWRRSARIRPEGWIGRGLDHESSAIEGDRPPAIRAAQEARLPIHS